MGSEALHQFCVDRVYEFATDIASEFDKVVDSCGMELLRPVILKTINVLEYLETSLLNLETSKKEIVELRNENQELLIVTTRSKSERIKLEQDLEELQEHADKEIMQLNFTIKGLQDNFRQLNESHQGNNTFQEINKEVTRNSDECLIECLQNTISTLTAKLEEKDLKLQEMSDKIIKLRCAIEDLSNTNKCLSNKALEAKKKMQDSKKKRLEMKQKVSELSTTLKVMEQSLNEAAQQKLDLEESYSGQSNVSSLISDDSDAELPTEKIESPMDKQQQLEKEALIIRIRQLEDELFQTRNESESFQHQYMQLQSLHTQQRGTLNRPSIRQLFQFILGIFYPVSGTFRC